MGKYGSQEIHLLQELCFIRPAPGHHGHGDMRAGVNLRAMCLTTITGFGEEGTLQFYTVIKITLDEI